MDIFSRAGMRECGFVLLLAVNSFRSCVDTLPNGEQGDAIKSPAPPAFILKDINTWPASSMATVFATNGERVFIDGGGRLWSSDGTTEGTVNLGPFWIPDLYKYGGVQAMEEYAVVLGDRLVYRAADPEHGAELWASDGTSEGTGLLGDLNPGPVGSTPMIVTALGGRLFFTADDGTHGRELWITDGTPEGTMLVKDINPGPGGSDLRSLTAVGERLFFTLVQTYLPSRSASGCFAMSYGKTGHGVSGYRPIFTPSRSNA